MNDINLDDIWALQAAVEGKVGLDDHQRGYGGLNNFPCGESALDNYQWVDLACIVSYTDCGLLRQS